MKVCYWGTFEPQYPRNAVLIAGLRQNGIEVIECHYELWPGAFRSNKLALLAGFGRKLCFAARAFLCYPVLIYRYLCLGDHDAVIIGYLGHFDIFFLAPFARLKGKPVVFDAFFSLYDTAILDWKLASKTSMLARACRFVDSSACRLAALVLVDTEAQKKFFCGEFGLAGRKVHRLYVGADDTSWTPCAELARPTFRVVYVGNYVPLHGVPIILQAARLLEEENIEFWLIGDNHQADGPADLLERAKYFPWMPLHELRDKIREADVCLGIFGTSDKAKRVIPGKAFLALAMGKALITGDSPAARELLEDGKNAVLCQMGSSEAVAQAICRLRNDAELRQRIAEEGRELFQRQCTPEIIGLQLARLIENMLVQQETGSVEAGERHHT
jgi:glycosyltransferase involved in cell wall biosynthesis